VPLTGENRALPTYRLGAIVPAGRTSRVGRAYHEVFRKPCVQKTVDLNGLVDSVYRNEPQFARDLHHPHVVEIWEAQHDPVVNGAVTFVMPVYPGGSVVEALVSGHRFSVVEAIDIAGHLADALAYVHDELGFLHRDVKPGNVLLNASRTSGFLSDFGSAARMDISGRTATAGFTEIYLDPAGLHLGYMDRTSDVYAAGLVLFEMLCGAFPYAAYKGPRGLARLGDGKRPLGSPSNRSNLDRWIDPAAGCTTQGRWVSSRPGSRPMQRARTTSSGCAGLGGSPVPAAPTPGGWWLSDGRIMCAGCGRRTSVTAGTIFDRTRTPLSVWFTACWLFASGKDGISALSLQRTLEIGSYQTAWAMLHRLRSVLVRPGRERLAGTVEVDEAYFGGEEPGLRGGRARGKKTLVAIAVEIKEPKGLGRCRMAVLADASASSLHPFVSAHVEPGATLVTDAWRGYASVAGLGYVHEARNQRAARERGETPGQLLPGVHRVASLAKRWLLGTHQGALEQAHLQSYLDEFTFRFNRRSSRSRGLLFYRLLELAVAHDPVRYHEIVVGKRPREIQPKPPGTRGHPPSLERSPVTHPWRLIDLDNSG